MCFRTWTARQEGWRLVTNRALQNKPWQGPKQGARCQPQWTQQETDLFASYMLESPCFRHGIRKKKLESPKFLAGTLVQVETPHAHTVEKKGRLSLGFLSVTTLNVMKERVWRYQERRHALYYSSRFSRSRFCGSQSFLLHPKAIPLYSFMGIGSLQKFLSK